MSLKWKLIKKKKERKEKRKERQRGLFAKSSHHYLSVEEKIKGLGCHLTVTSAKWVLLVIRNRYMALHESETKIPLISHERWWGWWYVKKFEGCVDDCMPQEAPQPYENNYTEQMKWFIIMKALISLPFLNMV